VPRRDPITRAGNKSPYTVLGKTYRVLPTAKGYRARGVASWYGTKFHGNSTANGERYDVYAMTAAHTTLPIPTYVRVTNLENGRQAVVRVNDRGPFAHGRIIDLSYAAATKLGFAHRGTARVEVEAVDVDNGSPPPVASTIRPAALPMAAAADAHYVQVGAFQSRRTADDLQQRLTPVARQWAATVTVQPTAPPTLYRVLVGPAGSRAAAEQLRSELLAGHVGDARIVAGAALAR
jgi:rare lipoprotein A